MVVLNEDGQCTVLDEMPVPILPLRVALDAADLKETYGDRVLLKDQSRKDFLMVSSSEMPNLYGQLDDCQNPASATVVPISSEQFKSLDSGDVIFIEDSLTVNLR